MSKWKKDFAGREYRLESGKTVCRPIEFVEAMEQTGSVVGKIKCTYAAIYNDFGQKMWSIQKKDAPDIPIVACSLAQFPKNDTTLIEVDLSQEAFAFINEMCKKHRKTAPKTILINEGKIYVKPCAFTWIPVQPSEANTQANQAKKKSNLALLIAGATLLLNS